VGRFFIVRFLVKTNSNPQRDQFRGAGHNPSFQAGETANGTIAILREAEAGGEVAADLLRKHGLGETMLELEISRLDNNNKYFEVNHEPPALRASVEEQLINVLLAQRTISE